MVLRFFFLKVKKCAQYMPGQYQCDNYLRPVFTLTNTEMLFRTFAVLSTLLMAISLILMLIGPGF